MELYFQGLGIHGLVVSGFGAFDLFTWSVGREFICLEPSNESREVTGIAVNDEGTRRGQSHLITGYGIGSHGSRRQAVGRSKGPLRRWLVTIRKATFFSLLSNKKSSCKRFTSNLRTFFGFLMDISNHLLMYNINIAISGLVTKTYM